MVDLHGLYVGEALEYAGLAFELAALEDDKLVRFIVGMSFPRAVRQHSKSSCRQRITCERWQGENSAGIRKTL